MQLFSPPMIATAAAIITLAGLAHGTLGFGFPIVSTPLVALFVDVKTAVLVTVLPNIAVNIVSILRGGNWRASIGKYWPLALWVVLGTLLGSRLLLTVPHEPLQLLLAMMIVVFLLQDRLRQIDWTWVKRKPRLAAFVFGLTAGVLSGAVNVALPPLVIYLMTQELTPLALTQTLNLCFIAGKTVQAIALGVSDAPSQQMLYASLPLVPLAVVAVYVGMRLQSRISAETYNGLLRKALGAIAAVLILQVILEVIWTPNRGS
ncbi:MAG: sulfite exporter TauE/SafE family protein [Pseudomonadota bacterium]|nr:sulfite exporter TauE/SafE family protein [Pseudomonadota bacterium]